MRADVLSLAQILARDLADATMLETFYAEAIRDLGLTSDHLTNITLISGVEGQSEYTLTDPGIKILAAFYDVRELWPESFMALGSAAGTDWRDAVGTAVAFTALDTTERTIRLFPIPQQEGQPFIPFASVLGAAYPGFNVFVAHTESRQDAPAYLDLYLALTILSREFARDSSHQDNTFAAACSALAALALAVVS